MGDGDDVQKTEMCIFIPSGDIHFGYHLTTHFSLSQAGLFFLFLFFSFLIYLFIFDCVLQEASHKQAEV